MQNKKAISDLIATVLMVLITIGVIGLIVGAVYPMIQKGIAEASAKRDCLNAGISTQEAKYLTPETLTVYVERSESTANVSKVTVKMIKTDGSSTTFDCASTPQQFNTVLCTNATTGIVKVEAFPFIRVGTSDIACSGTGEVQVI